MKKFLEMIEIAKRKGVVATSQDGRLARFPANTEFGRDLNFWKVIEECHPFVFAPKNEAPIDIDDDLKTLLGPDQRDLDAPFKVFSIEVAGQSICVPRDHDKIQTYVDCILVCELKPKEFVYFALCETRNGPETDRFIFSSNAEGAIVEEFLKRLNREATGLEHVRERIKIGTGSDKKTVTFRKVVHVRPRKSTISDSLNSRQIDWTHRWAVRGHWRKTHGYGKDRDGNYCVEGMTWVSEYEKGPEDAPMVKKTRIIA